MARSNNTKKSRGHGLIAGVLLAVFSLLVVAVVIDFIAFYILDIKYMSYKAERFFQYSALTGHFHKPNAEGNWYRYYDGTKFKVRTNKYGFADSEREVHADRPRIALVGDSVVEFWEVEEKDRGQHVIEALIDGECEVVTFGVRDFGTDQTYILFKNVGVHFSPDIVIYTFTINDIWDNAKTASKPYFVLDPLTPEGLMLKGYPVAMKSTADDLSVIDRLKRYSIVYRKLDFGVRLIKMKMGLPIATKSVPLEEHFELRPYKKVYDDEDSRRMEVTTRLITLLADFVRSQGMEFLVVEGLYKPVLDEYVRKQITHQYGDNFDYDKVSRILQDHCGENGIELISLPRLVQSQDIPASSLMHHDDAMHLNKAGIQLYSEAIVERLRSLGWIY